MLNRSSLNPSVETFSPIGDRLLLRRHKRPTEVGGIVLPTNARHVDQAKFDVIKAGSKCSAVKPGDVAIAPAQLAFAKVRVGDEELEVAPESILTAFIPA